MARSSNPRRNVCVSRSNKGVIKTYAHIMTSTHDGLMLPGSRGGVKLEQLVKNKREHFETWRKWLMCCRRIFQLCFLDWKFCMMIKCHEIYHFSTNRHWVKQCFFLPLRWRHNDHADVSNHQPHGCLLNRLFRRKSKKTSKLRVTGHCAGNSPGTGEFPAQMASYAENISIWWRHHAIWPLSELKLTWHMPQLGLNKWKPLF